MSYEWKLTNQLGLAVKLEAMFRLKPPYVPTTRKQFVKEHTNTVFVMHANERGEWREAQRVADILTWERMG
ncbi:MAG: hypothetical protein CME17_01145 [Gemmatimonadetes bacterium]|nr:hypothetical protein [Gemmatimonadota bacterium]|tara:strand:+ start:494 stop:706 length:213 start_codon:yes stop_codon:yes gene_type:complete